MNTPEKAVTERTNPASKALPTVRSSFREAVSSAFLIGSTRSYRAAYSCIACALSWFVAGCNQADEAWDERLGRDEEGAGSTKGGPDSESEGDTGRVRAGAAVDLPVRVERRDIEMVVEVVVEEREERDA